MAMGGMGGGGGSVSEINVTPLIDVLLVLLIIFMVIVPTTPKGLNALVPQPPKNKTPPPDNDRTIVLQIEGGAGLPVWKVNDQQFEQNDVSNELTKIFATRSEKVMFIKGDPKLDFGTVAQGIGYGKSAGVDNIGIITPQIEAGH